MGHGPQLRLSPLAYFYWLFTGLKQHRVLTLPSRMASQGHTLLKDVPRDMPIYQSADEGENFQTIPNLFVDSPNPDNNVTALALTELCCGYGVGKVTKTPTDLVKPSVLNGTGVLARKGSQDYRCC